MERRAALAEAAMQLQRASAEAAPAVRDALWQDGLDLLATAAGLKPVCLLGRGATPPSWLAEAAAIGNALGLARVDGPCWHPAGPFPDWYGHAITPRHRAATAIYLCRDHATAQRAAAACAAIRIAAAEEASLLGYPTCCVAHHHAQALAVERLGIEMILRLCGDDASHRDRLVAAGVMPTPQAGDEWRRWAAATAIAPQPWTSVNRCPACAADPTAPAARLGARWHAFARDVGYHALAAAA